MLGSCGAALYAPHNFVVERITIRLPRWPQALDGFRIAQLSDLHFGDYLHEPYFNDVVEAVNREKADLAFLTGDYISFDWPYRNTRARTRGFLWSCAKCLANLRARLGCYAVLGNHDDILGAEEVISAFGANDIPMLRNRSVAIETGSERFWLAGLDDSGVGHPDLPRTLSGIPPGEPIVLGVHEPDMADILIHSGVSLQLSGHSHGGQIRLPGIGAMVLPYGGRKYPMGHYRIGPMQLYTNRGIGVVNLPIRLFCPPEITILTLARG